MNFLNSEDRRAFHDEGGDFSHAKDEIPLPDAGPGLPTVGSINDLFFLRVCDMSATIGHRVVPDNLLAFSERINAELDKGNALTLKDLRIDGKKLMDLGIKPGPVMGEILKRLLDEVIEAPSLNNPEYLEKRALSLSRSQEQ